MGRIQDDDNKNINIKVHKYIRTFKYCSQCGQNLPEGSEDEFCDFYCRQEFFAENSRELGACYREWIGID